MQVLNYAAEAEHGLRKTAQKLRSSGMGDDADNMDRLARMIKGAVHFQLPDGGRVLNDDLKGLRGGRTQLFLPFPVITVSYYMPPGGGGLDGPHQTEIARKRCVVAWEADDSIFMVSTYEIIKDGSSPQWSVPTVWASLLKGMWEPSGEIEVPDFPSKNQISKNRIYFSPIVMMQGMFKIISHLHGKEVAMQMGNDDNDDIGSVLELAEALSCSNVSHEAIQLSDPVINARRQRLRKLPLYEVRTLTISVPGKRDASKDLGVGTHASPREHLRRGHIRNLSDGKRVWVQSCVVNGDSENGKISKGYSIRTA